ncbi:MAG: periplasmic heavy metal sensor [Syntrophobacterales bacterium]|jgi:Spy/CpxP family protein refolding chaperone
MLNKILKGMLLLVFVLSPGTALAQKVPGGKWWRSPRLSEQLNLSDEQKSQLDELYLNNRRNLIELKSLLERERLELGHLLDQETLNEASAIRQFEKLERARANLSTERFRYLLQVRKTIGYDRLQRLKEHFREFRREKMRRGPHSEEDGGRPYGPDERARNPRGM